MSLFQKQWRKPYFMPPVLGQKALTGILKKAFYLTEGRKYFLKLPEKRIRCHLWKLSQRSEVSVRGGLMRINLTFNF